MSTYKDFCAEMDAEHARARLAGLLRELHAGGFPKARLDDDPRLWPAPAVVEVPLPNGGAILWQDDADTWWYEVWDGAGVTATLLVRSVTATPDAEVVAVTRALAARYGS